MDGTDRVRSLNDWDFIGYVVASRSENGYEALRACAGERVEYQLGIKHEQRDTLAGQDDASGLQVACLSLCVSSTPLSAVQIDMAVSRTGFETGRLVLLWCACEGPVFEDPHGLLVCSKLTPLGEVNLPEAFIQEVPVRPPAKPQLGAGFLPCRSRRRCVEDKSTPKTPVGADQSPRRCDRVRQKSPSSAGTHVGTKREPRGPGQPRPTPCQAPKVPSSPQVPTQPQRPRSAPSYRPSSRLHNVLSRWGTPASEEARSEQPKERKCPHVSSNDDVLRPTRPAAPRPTQARQGLWVGRSAQLSGCV